MVPIDSDVRRKAQGRLSSQTKGIVLFPTIMEVPLGLSQKESCRLPEPSCRIFDSETREH